MNRALRLATLSFAVALAACSGNDQAPVGLSYTASPAVYTAGSAITPNQPRVGGGAVTSFSVWPALPTGLSMSVTTGVIEGTPTAVTAAAVYTVTAANSGGNASTGLLITVSQPPAPVIATQPVTQVVALDQVVTFSVTATGAGTLTYQWHRDGAALAGQVGASVTTDPVTYLDDDAEFTVVITDGYGGDVTSAVAKIRLEGFIAAASMATPRQNQAASKLSSGGKVLVTGGFSIHPLQGAELYDPATGAFAATGNLTAARQNHTSTLLGNGQVLLVGGQGGVGGGLALDTAELYSAGTEAFAPTTGLMGSPRVFHTATLLGDGTVLITGGLWNTVAHSLVSSAEVYDPATKTFLAAGSMTTGRYWHTATLLPDGQVLIAGGYGGSGLPLDSAELYDPATGLFTATGNMNSPRYGQTATLLSADGLVLVAGGYGAGVLAGAELYEPASGTFQTTTGALNVARQFHTATALPSGKVLLAGGLTATEGLESAELYDPVIGTFAVTDPMEFERAHGTATLLDSGEVLVLGGWSMSDAGLASAELFAGAP